jgi:formylmethanofuran dehydrogenase subunit E
MMNDLATLTQILEISSSRHSHLCPRQVLGARIGLAGAQALGLSLPRSDKRLLVILESDGCFADGVEAATGCSVGHRTLRVEDNGKVAATFVDVRSETCVRVAPRPDVRQRALLYEPGESRRYFAQLKAYQRMPDEELLSFQAVQLLTPVSQIISRPGVRVNCDVCGEEMINERYLISGGQTLCTACSGRGYYRVPEQEAVRVPSFGHAIGLFT